MGSSPIPSVSPLDSSVGRARTQRQMHLVYIAGWSSRLARLAHYQKVSGSNPLPATSISRRWSKGSSFGSLPKDKVRILRAQPKSVWAYLTKVRCLIALTWIS